MKQEQKEKLETLVKSMEKLKLSFELMPDALLAQGVSGKRVMIVNQMCEVCIEQVELMIEVITKEIK